MRVVKWLTGFSLWIALAAFARAETPYVVMISLDGFRHDYVEKHDAKHLAAIAKQGVRAEKMIPAYPSNTFPNHISLITGLLPVNHGIVNNAFYDKSRPMDDGYARYSMGKGHGDSTWLSGTPFWNLVEFNGLKSATYFWPESDARVNGHVPSYHFHYSKYADYQNRIDQIVEWLSLPEAARPHFIAGYFSMTDSVGHEMGPDADETRQAVQTMDGYMGQLFARLQALPIPVNLIIVSDHGMTNIAEDAKIDVNSLNIPDSFLVETRGTQVLIYGREEVSQADIDGLAASLKKQGEGRFTVMSEARRAEVRMPVNDRTGDLILEIQPPGYFINGEGHQSRGAHGFDPSLSDMGATFIAAGPAFKQGVTLPPMKNLEVYPGMAKLMGLEYVPRTDSDSAIFEQGLVSQD